MIKTGPRGVHIDTENLRLPTLLPETVGGSHQEGDPEPSSSLVGGTTRPLGVPSPPPVRQVVAPKETR